MNYTEKGSKLYLFSIVLVAVIGGLLFGYDTAVISGADKGLQAFLWVPPICLHRYDSRHYLFQCTYRMYHR